MFRENNTLTFLGMLVGLPLGKWLHAYVMSQIRIDTIAFDVRIAWQSVVFSMLLTAVFAAIVNVVMYFKLRRISMDALHIRLSGGYQGSSSWAICTALVAAPLRT